MKKVILLLLIFFFSSSMLFARQNEPMADRIEDLLKHDVFSVGLLLQSEAVFSFNDDNFNGGRAFGLGATRLDFRGRVDNNYIYRLQLDFTRPGNLVDANVGYLFSEEFRIITGLSKPSLSRDLDPSPADTDFINRARLVGVMMNPRELGVMFLGESGNFNYMFGMFNGTGFSMNNDNRFMYATRLAFDTETDNGSFHAGFNGAFNQTRNESVGNTGLVSQGDRVLYGAFLEYNSRPVFGTIEFMQTRFDAQNFGGAEETITGFYGTLGTNISDKSQLLVRYDRLDYDIRGHTSDLFIFGWNHQATRLISYQVNLLAQFDNDDDGQFGIAGVFQFHF